MGVMECRRAPRAVRALLIGAAVMLPAAAVIGTAGPASAQITHSRTGLAHSRKDHLVRRHYQLRVIGNDSRRADPLQGI